MRATVPYLIRSRVCSLAAPWMYEGVANHLMALWNLDGHSMEYQDELRLSLCVDLQIVAKDTVEHGQMSGSGHWL